MFPVNSWWNYVAMDLLAWVIILCCVNILGFIAWRKARGERPKQKDAREITEIPGSRRKIKALPQ